MVVGDAILPLIGYHMLSRIRLPLYRSKAYTSRLSTVRKTNYM